MFRPEKQQIEQIFFLIKIRKRFPETDQNDGISFFLYSRECFC
jgi:hypothetical protein